MALISHLHLIFDRVIFYSCIFSSSFHQAGLWLIFRARLIPTGNKRMAKRHFFAYPASTLCCKLVFLHVPRPVRLSGEGLLTGAVFSNPAQPTVGHFSSLCWDLYSFFGVSTRFSESVSYLFTIKSHPGDNCVQRSWALFITQSWELAKSRMVSFPSSRMPMTWCEWLLTLVPWSSLRSPDSCRKDLRSLQVSKAFCFCGGRLASPK